jgi:hypothetical protein
MINFKSISSQFIKGKSKMLSKIAQHIFEEIHFKVRHQIFFLLQFYKMFAFLLNSVDKNDLSKVVL